MMVKKAMPFLYLSEMTITTSSFDEMPPERQLNYVHRYPRDYQVHVARTNRFSNTLSLSFSQCTFGLQLCHFSPYATLQFKLVKFFHPLRSFAKCLKMSRSSLVLKCLICNR